MKKIIASYVNVDRKESGDELRRAGSRGDVSVDLAQQRFNSIIMDQSGRAIGTLQEIEPNDTQLWILAAFVGILFDGDWGQIIGGSNITE